MVFSAIGRDIDSIEKTIVFDKETFKWNPLQTCNNPRTINDYNIYTHNPIVITIKDLIMKNPQGIEITATDLLQNIYETTKTSPKQNSPQSITRYINTTLQHLLLEYDGIHYVPPTSNGGSTGRKMFFCKPIVQQVTTETKQINNLEE